jgi:hypothetical protein
MCAHLAQRQYTPNQQPRAMRAGREGKVMRPGKMVMGDPSILIYLQSTDPLTISHRGGMLLGRN